MTRVLLIEDNPSHARLVREMLFDEWGQLADVSHRGMLADVEPALAQASYCILLDLSLPDSEGLEAVVELRAIASDVPIVVLSARGDDATETLE